MGQLRTGIPKDFVIKIINSHNFENFVETGTFKGETTIWAAKKFKKVHSIEAYKPLFDEMSSKYSTIDDLVLHFGKSEDKLPDIIQKLDGPAIFWLDAHYSGEGTFGNSEKCPLINEIEIINTSNFDNIVLIDDAFVFLSPPTKSHNIEEWPNLADIFKLLDYKGNNYIIILEDVIFCVPIQYKKLTAEYAQNINSINSFADSFGTKEFIKKLLRYIIRKKN